MARKGLQCPRRKRVRPCARARRLTASADSASLRDCHTAHTARRHLGNAFRHTDDATAERVTRNSR